MLNNFNTTSIRLQNGDDYKVLNLNGGLFIVELPEKKYLKINVEGRGNKSIYFKPIVCFDGVNNKTYSANKYLYKYIGLTREIAFALRQMNAVWDYKDNKVLEPIK